MLPKALQKPRVGVGLEQTSAWPKVGPAVLASAVPALGKPLWLTAVVREHPRFFGLSVTTSLQISVLAITPPPGPFLILSLVCPLPFIGLGLVLSLLIFSEAFWSVPFKNLRSGCQRYL